MISDWEVILNSQGSVFHLHLKRDFDLITGQSSYSPSDVFENLHFLISIQSVQCDII